MAERRSSGPGRNARLLSRLGRRAAPGAPAATETPGGPVPARDAAFESVLVYAEDGVYNAQVIATAQKLASRRRRGIHVLVTVAVPHALAIDAPMADAMARADSVIEQARVQGGRRVTGHVERIRAGQAGRRIVEEARALRATAVVLPLPRRISGGSLFGKTLATVLAERPCRVIIESPPAGRAAGSGAATAVGP